MLLRLLLLLVIEDAVFFLECHGHLCNARSYDIEKVLHDLVSLVLEEHLEILDDYIARRVTFYSNSQDVLFNLRHRWLPHKFFIFAAEHGLALLFKLWELL